MGKPFVIRLLGNVGISAIVAFSVAACTTSGSGGMFGALKKKDDAPPPPQISDAALHAYCPPVQLRDGTAYYNTYEKGAKDDPTRIVYQASLTDTTRNCTRANGNLVMDVAAAGKVVPGSKVKAGTITMPIRVAVLKGDKVVFSKLEKYPVEITDMNAATQFIFNEKGVTIPEADAQSVRVYVGYDEGPYNTP